VRRQLRRIVAPALLAVMLGAVSPFAQAGLFDDTEARAGIEELRKKLAETDKQAEMLGRNQLDFANQLEMLKAEIARIRGQLEVLVYEVEATQKRQKDFYVDLDSRLRKIEGPIDSGTPAPAGGTNAGVPAGAGATAARQAADPAAENADYEAAVTALKASKFRPAADGFQVFIKKHPESTLLASAHYWGAYAHSQLKEYAKAAELFGKFAAGWPNDERVPGALESQIASLEIIKDIKGARAATELLATKYPNSDAGKRAKLKLKKK
jgi:tol-pal system protein YbgF